MISTDRSIAPAAPKPWRLNPRLRGRLNALGLQRLKALEAHSARRPADANLHDLARIFERGAASWDPMHTMPRRRPRTTRCQTSTPQQISKRVDLAKTAEVKPEAPSSTSSVGEHEGDGDGGAGGDGDGGDGGDGDGEPPDLYLEAGAAHLQRIRALQTLLNPVASEFCYELHVPDRETLELIRRELGVTGAPQYDPPFDLCMMFRTAEDAVAAAVAVEKALFARRAS